MKNLLSAALAWSRRTRPWFLILAVVSCSCFCCFGQLPTDLDLPSETLDSGNPAFEASNSITNSASFVVLDSASVTLAAGSYIKLEPGFDAVAGSAPFTFFAVINPNISQSPPNEGSGPPSIPGSYTAAAYSPKCDNISGEWIDSDNVGNSIAWDLNQTSSSITGTLSFQEFANYGNGPVSCGTTTYTASGIYNGNGNYSLSAVNPVPPIDSCGFTLAPSETENVTVSGQACGSGTAAYTISGGGVGPYLALPRAATRFASAAISQAAQPSATSGTSTWATYSPRFNVSYASYIPVDNITGPTPCFYSPGGITPIPIFKIYKGDANRGTYRTTQAIFTVPDKQYDSNFFANTGETRNYGQGSPANGSTLSSSPTSPDIYNGPYAGADEDQTPFDCKLWNANGQATTANMQSYNVTFPGSHQAVITLSGVGNDPLEPQFGGIQWNATITLDTTNPNSPTAQATITHTCYPAHIIKVNGVTILNDMPNENDTLYLLKCLGDPTHLTWTTTTTGTVSIPNH